MPGTPEINALLSRLIHRTNLQDQSSSQLAEIVQNYIRTRATISQLVELRNILTNPETPLPPEPDGGLLANTFEYMAYAAKIFFLIESSRFFTKAGEKKLKHLLIFVQDIWKDSQKFYIEQKKP